MITWGPHGLSYYWDVIEHGEFYVGHYGRNGEQISMRHWGYLVESRLKIVKQEQIGDYFVSTVLIGLDHGVHGAPLIFETMVFKPDDPEHPWRDLDTRRYSTWAEALAGHREMANEVALLVQLDF